MAVIKITFQCPAVHCSMFQRVNIELQNSISIFYHNMNVLHSDVFTWHSRLCYFLLMPAYLSSARCFLVQVNFVVFFCFVMSCRHILMAFFRLKNILEFQNDKTQHLFSDSYLK